MINEFPYTNMVYQNIDWLIKEVTALKNQGKTAEETSEKVSKSIFAQSGVINQYPYTNMVYQNIDWLIKEVYEMVSRIDSAESAVEDVRQEITKLAEDDLALQEQINTFNSLLMKKADIDYVDDKFVHQNHSDAYLIYGTDERKMDTVYRQSAQNVAYTIPLRDGDGNINIGITPTIFTSATSKKYVDDKINDALIEAQAYTDRHSGGGWETVKEIIAETDVDLSEGIEWNKRGKDITAIRVSVFADSGDDVNKTGYDETSEIGLYNGRTTSTKSATVAKISRCLPQVFGTAIPTTDLIELGNTYYSDNEGNTLPANTYKRESLGRNAITNPSNIVSGGTSKLQSAGTDYTIDSYILGRTVNTYAKGSETYEATHLLRAESKISTTLPPGSIQEVYEYMEGDYQTPLTTPDNKTYLDEVFARELIKPYSLAGAEFTINYGDKHKTVLDDKLYYYTFTVTGQGGTYDFVWYWGIDANRQYAHLYGTSEYCPNDLAFRIDEVTVEKYVLQKSVECTGFYASNYPSRVIYVSNDGEIYASENDITECTLSYTNVELTKYKGIFTAEIAVYGSNAVCTHIEGTSTKFTEFNQSVPIDNFGEKYACDALPYLKIKLAPNNKLYKGSKIRVETISTREEE